MLLVWAGCGSSDGGSEEDPDGAVGPGSDAEADSGPNEPPVVTCPDDVSVEVQETADLVADIEDDGDIEDRQWTVVSAPAGSKAAPMPDGNSATMFTPLLPGEYVLSYTVEDDAGQTDSCEVTVTATVMAGFRVEVLWDVDADPPPPADMDLHVIHPSATVWFDPVLDCNFANVAPSWGPGGIEDDPLLFADDQDGRGPEGIEVDVPEDGAGAYGVGVHFFGTMVGGPSEATVNIYCGGSLMQTFGPQSLTAGEATPPDNQFWKVADVSFSSGACTVTALNDIVTGVDAALAR